MNITFRYSCCHNPCTFCATDEVCLQDALLPHHLAVYGCGTSHDCTLSQFTLCGILNTLHQHRDVVSAVPAVAVLIQSLLPASRHDTVPKQSRYVGWTYLQQTTIFGLSLRRFVPKLQS